MPSKYVAPNNHFTKKGDLHHMDEEFTVDVDEAQETDLPQGIKLDPDKVIGQLMRRFTAQVQNLTWENTLLATENEHVKTLLQEAGQEREELQDTIADLSRENEYIHGVVGRLSKRLVKAEDLEPLVGTQNTAPRDLDAFELASEQPGFAGGEQSAESSDSTTTPPGL